MTRRSSLRVTIAAAGLGILTATRLKVVCNLLAAEQLDVSLVEWGEAHADILIADTTSTAGRSAASVAVGQRLPLLTFNRVTGIGPSTSMSLPLNATVKDIAAALKQLIAVVLQPITDHNPTLPPLLQALDRSQPRSGIVELNRGGAAFAIDHGNGLIHLQGDTSVDDILAHATAADWSHRPLSGNAQDALRVHEKTDAALTIESLWWRIATHVEFDLPADGGTRAVHLSAWPELDAQSCPTLWLPAIACLMYSDYSADTLAMATGIPLRQTRRILQTAQFSGLATTTPSQRSPGQTTGKSSLSQSFLNVAKRFGLKLFGRQHG